MTAQVWAEHMLASVAALCINPGGKPATNATERDWQIRTWGARPRDGAR